ncbi:unnamed protein product [Adineta steineri]|uniref:Uncharacterized protein n=1 Tax=Adineta steineri TaxID=433720 RepID=A0A818M7S8_9BILA|nr:unnamed protein product [Adineta steineri]
MTLIYFLFYLGYFITFSNTHVLLYHTENSLSVQYYDCIYYTRLKIQDNIQDIKYCRQFNESQTLQRDFNQSCHNNGQLWTFEKLSSFNMSPSDVLQWSSSLEQTDRYSQYLSNKLFDMTNAYLCNCTNPSSFGKFCEYKFYGDSTFFNDAIKKQFQPLEHFPMSSGKIHVGSQLHNNRPCYITLICDSGLMCLDWRHICDGKQQCMDGIDEDYCERLEFNECEDDEYRCANGMCIPDEYWLDGDFDCMDWTDEKGILANPGASCFSTPSLICDERVCQYHQWSCGDGQCVNFDTDRFEGIRKSQYEFCQNMRDVNYMCEAVKRDSKSWWTITNGYCLPYSLSYRIFNLDLLIIADQCIFAVKCALSDGLDQDCHCKNSTECRLLINNTCSDSFLNYPASGALLTPYVHMVYERDRDWKTKKPDRIRFDGRVKCIGYQMITKSSPQLSFGPKFRYYDYRKLENTICNFKALRGTPNYTGLHYDKNCWNDSKTSNNHSYQVSFFCESRCISKYRIRDGIWDCDKYEEDQSIQNTCSQIQHHRFQCSSSDQTCLLVGTLGDWFTDCSDGRDEIDDNDESDTIPLINIACNQKTDPECNYLRKYIQSSSMNNTKKIISVDQSTRIISFRLYCNSFFDTKSAIDELPDLCQSWICSIDQYQCLSGQCIPQEWICDGEWDCSDGSDEERLLIINNFKEHNLNLKNLTQFKQQCYQRYQQSLIPFANICNLSFEYPCFRVGINDIFNISFHRPCINLTQIGDGIIDCLTALDERNHFQCLQNGMLGYHVQYNHTLCIPYARTCSQRYPWTPGSNLAYDSVCFYRRLMYKNGTNSSCNTGKDVLCLNDTCIKNARCNGIIECAHGEDEYRCVPENQSPVKYRSFKTIKFLPINLSIYPFLNKNSSLVLIENKTDMRLNIMFENDLTRVFGQENSNINQTIYENIRDNVENSGITFEKDYLPFICNRGLAVKYLTGHTICFCPPNFYGLQCEYYSDRLTILTSLQQIILNQVKVLAIFSYKNETIDLYEFYIHSNSFKQQINFNYPRFEKYLHFKQIYRNGTQLYNIRFEIYRLNSNETIDIIGVWKYSIEFDFLPSFRLAKILRLSSSSSCSSNHSCTKNGICQQIINRNDSSYFCSCQNGFYGLYCEYYDHQCRDYCSLNAICKPKYRGILTGNQSEPYCLCPLSTFGPRCYFKNKYCQFNPCLNQGTCFITSNLANINEYICICTNFYEGKHCEFSKGMINIRINSSFSINDILATTVFYNDYDQETLRFLIRYQQVYSSLHSQLKPIYIGKVEQYAPIMAIMKIYRLNYESEYYLLYYHPNKKTINITVDLTLENYCPLWYLMESNEEKNSTISVFFYHRLCQLNRNKRNYTCFRDWNYFCICELNHSRAECFGYNHSIDQCSHCVSNGFCLKEKVDFLCLCRRCSYGHMCQYSTEWMSFTLDSLIIKDLDNNRRISIIVYIFIVCLIFLFGLLNNFNSFLTFIRPKSRKSGVVNYLLIISIIDQCSLLLLLLKIIHTILGYHGILFFYTNTNLYSCKILSYLLSVLTRITYWLTSLITIERLCLVLFPTSSLSKNQHRIIIMIIFVIVYYSNLSRNATLCVTNYTQSLILTYHRINVFIHYLIPFLIQIIAITILIIQVACNRVRISNQTFLNLFIKQIKTQKEQYITPIIIIISSLPQIILAFSYSCTELKQSWQRYTLLTTYFLSYLPQMLGFILYVLPSTTYSQEFRQTPIGKRILRQRRLAKAHLKKKILITKPTVPTDISSLRIPIKRT